MSADVQSQTVHPEVHTDPSSIDINGVPKLAKELVFRETSRNLRMAFDRASGVMFEFNDSASSFLALIDGKRSLKAIAIQLSEEYDAPAEDIEEDLRDLIARMIDAGVVAIVGGAS